MIEMCNTYGAQMTPSSAGNFTNKRYAELKLMHKLQAAKKVFCGIMFDKFDHKLKGNRYYNFVVVFAGLFFAAFMIMPDEWRKPAPLILVVFISAAIAKFSASNSKQG